MDQPPDLSVFWYTHSTICQTLASAFGFLTAVGLYQMQALGASMVSIMNLLRSWTNDTEGRHITMEYSHDIWSFENYVDQKGFRPDRLIPSHYKDMYDNYKLKMRTLRILQKSLRCSLVYTSGTIAWSLASLYLTNSEMVTSFGGASAMVAVASIFFVICGASYVLFALTLVGEPGAVERLERFWDSMKLPSEESGNA